MNKRLVYTAVISGLIVALLALPGINRSGQGPGAEGEPATMPTSMTEVETPKPDVEEVPEKEPVLQPAVEIDWSEDGFRLVLDEHTYVDGIEGLMVADKIVHLLARTIYAEGDTVSNKYRYDAAVVQPDGRELQTFPLYEAELTTPPSLMAFRKLDEQHVMFIRRSEAGGRLIHDLARLNITTGVVDDIASRFWEVEVPLHEPADDFLLSVVQPANGAGGKVLLTSFKGKTWLIDTESGNVQWEGTQLYPAYGDMGSKPLRGLVYPSPDLKRFVNQGVDENQILVTNQFRIIDADNGSLLRSFDIDNAMAVMDDGIGWNGESSYFYLEYADRDKPMGAGYDNASYVFAQHISFYSRDGELVRTLSQPNGSVERMSVFNWVNENQLLIEMYKPYEDQEGSWLKGRISYKLYDLQSGRLTPYRTTDSANQLENPEAVSLHNAIVYDSKAFVMADYKHKRIWEPQLEGRTFRSNGQLYAKTWGGDPPALFRWDEKRRGLEWVADEGESTIIALQGDWSISRENKGHSVLYQKLISEAKRNDDGLPIVQTPFPEETAGGEWWKTQSGVVPAQDGETARVEGKSRYGDITLQPEAGEVTLKIGESYRYYGNYVAWYTDSNGRKRSLPSLDGLSLHQEKAVGEMRSYSLDGYDVVIFQPTQYRFTKGFDGGIKKVFAYVITEKGEAFPLQFQYASTSGMTRSDMITIHDHAAIELRDGEIIVQSALAEGRYELAWTPSLRDHTLTLTGMVDKTAQYTYLNTLLERYTNYLEQAFGLEEGYTAEEKLNEERLRALFTEEAWSSRGFEQLKSRFDSEAAAAGSWSRAFAWSPIDARFDESGRIHATFTINLWYAIGLAAHLDAVLSLDDGEWRFQDFGKLEVEKLEFW